jgi:hypothetical protein
MAYSKAKLFMDSKIYLKFHVLTAVNMKVAVFCDVTPYSFVDKCLSQKPVIITEYLDQLLRW